MQSHEVRDDAVFEVEAMKRVVRTENSQMRSRRAAAGRAELLAKEGQYTDRLQNPAKLRRFRIGGRIGGGDNS